MLVRRARCVRSFSSSSSKISGDGALSVVFGGFGFTQRQIVKHEAIYREHGFECLPVLSSIPQLISPKVGWQRGPELAARVQEHDAPTVVHMVSGGFWTGVFMLAHLDEAWRERNIRAIMFDSCPPKSDVYAFGGWLAWFLQAKTTLPSRLTKPFVSQLFHPVRPLFGIDAEWTAQNDAWMYGDEAIGRRARELPALSGGNQRECAANAAAAYEAAVAAAAEPAERSSACVVPRSTACLFVRGRNDPVLEPQYIDAFYAFLKARSTATVEWHLFERAQHAMAVVEAPGQYKAQHVENLLSRADLT